MPGISLTLSTSSKRTPTTMSADPAGGPMSMGSPGSVVDGALVDGSAVVLVVVVSLVVTDSVVVVLDESPPHAAISSAAATTIVIRFMSPAPVRMVTARVAAATAQPGWQRGTTRR